MSSESFATTLKKTIEQLNSFKYLFYLPNEKTEFENILLNFEKYGSFLDSIPIKERGNIITAKLFPWIKEYTKNSSNTKLEELFPFKENWEPEKEIKKPLKIIQKFEKMLHEIYDPKDDFIKHFNEKGVPPLAEEEQVYTFLKEMLDNTEILRKDLEDANFKIFPKVNYYKFKKTSKKALEIILIGICKDYNIENVNDKIKTLKTLPVKNKS